MLSTVTRNLLLQLKLHRGIGEGVTPLPGSLHFTLDTYLIVLRIKQGSIKLHFCILGMTRSEIELRSPESLANTYSLSLSLSLSIYIYIYQTNAKSLKSRVVRACVCVCVETHNVTLKASSKSYIPIDKYKWIHIYKRVHFLAPHIHEYHWMLLSIHLRYTLKKGTHAHTHSRTHTFTHTHTSYMHVHLLKRLISGFA